MRTVSINDVKQAFMEKTDLTEKIIQSIIDELPTTETNGLVKVGEKPLPTGLMYCVNGKREMVWILMYISLSCTEMIIING